MELKDSSLVTASQYILIDVPRDGRLYGDCGTHHPEITVRTAYDLKPCDSRLAHCKMRIKASIRITAHVNNNFGDPHGCGSRRGPST